MAVGIPFGKLEPTMPGRSPDATRELPLLPRASAPAPLKSIHRRQEFPCDSALSVFEKREINFGVRRIET
jgi:hypothetical protein